jgi:hypothetical protein
MRYYLKHYGLSISRHGATKVTHIELGQEVILPVEVNLVAYRLTNRESVADYHDLMMDNIDEVTDRRLQALKDTFRVAKAYNKKVKLKSFQVGDLV